MRQRIRNYWVSLHYIFNYDSKFLVLFRSLFQMGKELLSGGLHMRNKAELNISADAFFLLMQVPILLLTPKNEKATQDFF